MRLFLSILFINSTLIYHSQQNDTLQEFIKVLDINEASDEYNKTTILTTSKFNCQIKGSLADALNDQPDVFIKSYGVGGTATLSIRGGGANHTAVVWNDLALNSPTLGQTDLSLIPIEFTDQVDLYQGVSSNAYGYGGIAGSLVLRNKSKFYKHQLIRVKKELGSYSQNKTVIIYEDGNNSFYSKTVALKFEAENNFEYLDYSSFNSNIKERENAYVGQYGFQQDLGYKKGRHHIGLAANYLNSNRKIPIAIGVASQEQHQLDESTKIALHYNLEGKKEAKLDMRHKFVLGLISDKLLFENYSTDIRSSFYTQTLSGQYHNLWKINPKFRLKSQITGYQLMAKSDGFAEQKIQPRYALFEELGYSSNQFSLSIHLREEVIEEEFSPLIIGGAFKYNITENFDASINLGRNYHYPTLNDLYWSIGGNPNLQPELANQGEMNLHIRSKNKYYNKPKWDINTNLFYSIVDNWIQWTPETNGIWTAQNVKKVSKAGASLKVNSAIINKLDKNLNISFGYQFLEVKNVSSIIENDEGVGKTLIYTPKHSLHGGLQFAYKQFSFKYSQNFTDKVYLDVANTTYLPYSAPANVEFRYLIKDDSNNLTASIIINNLFDETYQTVANQPLPGRNFLIRLTLNLGK